MEICSRLVHHSLCRTPVGRTHEALPPAVELATKLREVSQLPREGHLLVKSAYKCPSFTST